MNRHWHKRRDSLEAAINAWFEGAKDWAEDDEDPWIGFETARCMADAAISVLRGIRDAESHMAKEAFEPKP